MAGVSFTGLSSGLDTDSIISALMSVESVGRTRLVTNQQAASARQQGLQDVLSRMKTLRLAAQDLGSSLLWTESQKAESTDDKSVAATLTGGAAPGGYSVTVTQLASAAQSTFAYSSQIGASTIDVNGVTVNLPANADIDTAVSTINQTANVGVYAVNLGNGKMVLSSRTTGSAVNIAASGAALALDSTKAGRDLQYAINGDAQPDSQSNTVANAIPGVSLTFKAPTTATTVNVSDPGVDPAAIKTKLKAFVSAYNDVVQFTNGKLTEKKVVKNSSESGSDANTNLTAAEAAKGVLFGDQGLRGLLTSMRTKVSDTVSGIPGNVNTFAALGITTGAPTGGAATSTDSKNGLLTFDEKTFDAAYKADPLAVKKLVGGVSGTDGLSQTWDAIIKPQVEANGLLDQRVSMAGNEVTRIKDSISRMDTRLADKQEQLKKMFTNMELALAKSKSQTGDLLGSLGSSSSSK